MDDRRRDPEALLARAREEEARKHRGKPKVFFGSGVGKTYAMLQAAREQQAGGFDVVAGVVVAGVVETHGRAESESLLEASQFCRAAPSHWTPASTCTPRSTCSTSSRSMTW